MFFAIGLCETAVRSRGDVEGFVPFTLFHVGAARAVDGAEGCGGVEGERVGGDADDVSCNYSLGRNDFGIKGEVMVPYFSWSLRCQIWRFPT